MVGASDTGVVNGNVAGWFGGAALVLLAASSSAGCSASITVVDDDDDRGGSARPSGGSACDRLQREADACPVPPQLECDECEARCLLDHLDEIDVCALDADPSSPARDCRAGCGVGGDDEDDSCDAAEDCPAVECPSGLVRLCINGVCQVSAEDVCF